MSAKIKGGEIWGKVKTQKSNSLCEFFICEKEEWDKLSENDQEKLMVDAMWQSGHVEVYAFEKE